jgi:FG-GAP-like repeat/FG-GAP repeat/Abnormal spindle-like microcephaly-assoc'd, ASPM-SPD-2-Hydin
MALRHRRPLRAQLMIPALFILLSAPAARSQGLFDGLPITTLLPISTVTALQTGDFNRDGILDIVVVGPNYNQPINDLQILLGNGDGTFNPGYAYSVQGDANRVAVADFNSDGYLDLAIVTDNTVDIMLGNGDGTFQAPVSYAAGYLPLALAVGDLNGDGCLDVAVGNQHVGEGIPAGGFTPLLGDCDGEFKTGSSSSTARNVRSIAVGDLNGDGFADVITGNLNSRSISVVLSNGDGTFQAPVNYTADFPDALALGDLNGDGHLDLVMTNTTSGSPANGGVMVMLGNGDGTFGRGRPINVGLPGSYSVALADFNADGILDIAVGGSSTLVQPQLNVILGNGDGTFWPVPRAYQPGGYPIVAGDLNGDGLPDAAFLYKGVTALLNQGPAPAASVSPSSITFPDTTGGSTSASQWVTLTNTGSTSLQISSISLGGANPGDFLESTKCGSALAFGASCSIRLAFRPTLRGTRTATLTITDNALMDPQQTVTLSGTGEPRQR